MQNTERNRARAGDALDLPAVRELLDDLRDPKPMVYYIDLMACSILGWGLIALALRWEFGIMSVLAFVAGGLLLYRGLAFIHELFHQQRMKAFRHAWHLLIGVPLLLPVLLYLPIHQAHHSSKTYGTKEDGEYDQFRGRFWLMVSKLFALNLALPLALWVRFAVLTPLSFVIPVVRNRVIPEFIHLSLRIPFRAPEIKENLRRETYFVEAACSLFAWGLMALAVSGHWRLLLWWAVLVFAIATLNTVRALCSTHLYVEEEEGRSARGQLLDSLNVDGSLLAEIICPVGLKFHALHHIVPNLPYHALPLAHARLMTHLPADSEYRQACVTTMWQGWQRVVQASKREA
jgi:fatty acid desaturase